MKNPITKITDSLNGFTTRNGKFIFTTFARILAVGCAAVAAYFAWKLGGQLAM